MKNLRSNCRSTLKTSKSKAKCSELLSKSSRDKENRSNIVNQRPIDQHCQSTIVPNLSQKLPSLNKILRPSKLSNRNCFVLWVSPLLFRSNRRSWLQKASPLRDRRRRLPQTLGWGHLHNRRTWKSLRVKHWGETSGHQDQPHPTFLMITPSLYFSIKIMNKLLGKPKPGPILHPSPDIKNRSKINGTASPVRQVKLFL